MKKLLVLLVMISMASAMPADAFFDYFFAGSSSSDAIGNSAVGDLRSWWTGNPAYVFNPWYSGGNALQQGNQQQQAPAPNTPAPQASVTYYPPQQSQGYAQQGYQQPQYPQQQYQPAPAQGQYPQQQYQAPPQALPAQYAQPQAARYPPQVQQTLPYYSLPIQQQQQPQQQYNPQQQQGYQQTAAPQAYNPQAAYGR